MLQKNTGVYAAYKPLPPLSVPVKHKTHLVVQAMQTITAGSIVLVFPDGSHIKCEGSKPGSHADMRFYDWKVLDRMISHGDIGWGEDYALGLWETHNLKTLMQFMAENADAFHNFSHGKALFRLAHFAKRKLFVNSLPRSRKNIHDHYDLGNHFYKHWLDNTMTYSCALFGGDPGKSLEEAQKAKYQRIISKLNPGANDHILEIGCGWGGFMEETAKMGCRVTGVTLSPEQARWAQDRLEQKGLHNLAKVHLQDYRLVDGKYDGIASIGMFEHVGEEYWPEYMENLRRKLKSGGKAMVQTIIIRDDLFHSYRKSSDFIREHIFPGGMLPSRAEFEKEALRAGLRVKDVFHFGRDYAITLGKWLERFDDNIDDIQTLGYCDTFVRKWRFYLASCAGMFNTGRIDVMQVELENP